MKCIAVDDEPLALDLINDFVGKIPFLEMVKLCKNAFEALEVLQKEKIDLVFLDIQMPELSGLQLVKSLNQQPSIIFTTAYSEYAVDGFDLDAVDYLVKPFAFERFLKAVNKAHRLQNASPEAPIPAVDQNITPAKEFLFIKEGNNTTKLDLNDILYIEGLKDYIKIFTPERNILTLASLKNFEEKLPKKQFIRVHRSYIVAIKKIDYIQRNRIVIGKNWIPIGDHYKDNFSDLLEEYK